MANDWLNAPLPLTNKKIWVAGHKGMVGSALTRRLEREDCTLLTTNFDLRNQADALRWLHKNKPDIIIIAAAKVGGILANSRKPAEFLYDNLMIETNIIHAAHLTGVEKLLFLGSSCIYPRETTQPITEDALLTAALEPTNEAYALAKITGIKLCESYRAQYGANFISAMPCNLYGPGDTFDLNASHVIPALMMKAHEAKIKNEERLDVWGSGDPMREFLHVDDLADALIFLLQNYQGAQHINVGYGEDISITALTHKICKTVGFTGDLLFDPSMPSGTLRKLMDSQKIHNAGWSPQTTLESGLKTTYAWYRDDLKQNPERYAA